MLKSYRCVLYTNINFSETFERNEAFTLYMGSNYTQDFKIVKSIQN